MSTTALQAAVAALADDDLLEHWQRPPADLDFGFPDDQITAMVDATEGWQQRSRRCPHTPLRWW